MTVFNLTVCLLLVFISGGAAGILGLAVVLTKDREFLLPALASVTVGVVTLVGIVLGLT